jgi:hypothetical protein
MSENHHDLPHLSRPEFGPCRMETLCQEAQIRVTVITQVLGV